MNASPRMIRTGKLEKTNRRQLKTVCEIGAETREIAESGCFADGPSANPQPLPLIMNCMEYVNLGKTGLKVSRLCLGCMTYGSSKWREWVLNEEESRPFFKRAIEAGIN